MSVSNYFFNRLTDVFHISNIPLILSTLVLVISVALVHQIEFVNNAFEREKWTFCTRVIHTFLFSIRLKSMSMRNPHCLLFSFLFYISDITVHESVST